MKPDGSFDFTQGIRVRGDGGVEFVSTPTIRVKCQLAATAANTSFRIVINPGQGLKPKPMWMWRSEAPHDLVRSFENIITKSYGIIELTLFVKLSPKFSILGISHNEKEIPLYGELPR